MENTLIVSVVPHGSGEVITGAAVDAGAKGGTILMGRGIAQNALVQLLGFGDKMKDIACIIVQKAQTAELIAAVKKATKKKAAGFGSVFTLDLSYFSYGKSFSEGVTAMEQKHQIIAVIANKGYGDDIMAAARKAGAGGGTVVTARGTAKEGDEKFLGMEIVPEKEMLYIITETEKVLAIIDAVKNLDCLAKPGSGIVFAAPIGDFTVLGRAE